jgi:hypothetical protein
MDWVREQSTRGNVRRPLESIDVRIVQPVRGESRGCEINWDDQRT